MEEQGIMGLAPQAAGAAPPMPPQGMMPPEIREASPEEQMAAADMMYQARKEMPKNEISRDIMDGAAQADPQEVEMFKQALSANPLPRDLIDALLQMIQLIYENPGEYPAIRQELLAEGVPPELLPEQLDLGFFTSLEMALYEVPSASSEMGIGAMAPPEMMAPMAAPPMPQGFKDGGIVSLKPIAKELQSLGRYGDTMLAHINPQEARMLKAMGGSGTINPYTGLPEFIKIGNPFKAVGKAISGVAKGIGKAVSGAAKAVGSAVKGIAGAVKKFASSTVGRVVTTVALGFLVGPAAASMLGVSSVAGVAAVSGFIGSGGATLLAGGSIKDAIKSGVTGAVVAGAGATIFNGGSAAWAKGSYTGPTTITDQWNRVTDSVSKAFSTSPTDVTGNVADPFSPTAGGPPLTPEQALEQASAPPGDLYASARSVSGTMTDSPVFDTLESQVASNNIVGSEISAPSAAPSAIPSYGELLASESAAIPGAAPTATTPFDLSATGGAGADASFLSPDFYADNAAGPAIQVDPRAYTDPYASSPAGIQAAKDTAAQQVAQRPSFFEDPVGAAKDLYNRNLPSTIEKEGFDRSINAYNEAFARTGSEKLALQAAEKATPGVLAKYGPMAVIGTGATALAIGATTPPEAPVPTDFETTGMDLIDQDPGKYRVNLGEVSTSEAPVSPQQIGYGDLYLKYMDQARQQYDPLQFAQINAAKLRELDLSPMSFAAAPSAPAPAMYNMGGFVGNRPTGGIGAFGMGYKRGGMPRHYPRKTGPINGPGTGTSDSIPAMLSDGEFVFTAKAVRGMGNGSRKEGAKKMYAMMKALEGNA